MDVGSDVRKSIDLLLHHKRIILPVLGSIVLPLVLIFLFLQLSGISPLLHEFATLQEEFDQQKVAYLLDKDNLGEEGYGDELANYLGRQSSSSTYNDELAAYLESRGYDWGRFWQLLNVRNIVLLIVLLLVGLLGSFYFSCMSYALIALTMQGKRVTLQRLWRMTNAFLFRLLSLRLIILFLLIAPLLIGVIVVTSFFFISILLGAFSVLLFFILFLIYVFILSIRFFFATPSMYLEQRGPVDSLRHSFQLTKGHLRQVLIIFFVIYATSIFMNNFIAQPLYGSFSNTLTETQLLRAVLSFVLVLLFALIESFVFTFEHIFLFYSYVDFKD